MKKSDRRILKMDLLQKLLPRQEDCRYQSNYQRRQEAGDTTWSPLRPGMQTWSHENASTALKMFAYWLSPIQFSFPKAIKPHNDTRRPTRHQHFIIGSISPAANFHFAPNFRPLTTRFKSTTSDRYSWKCHRILLKIGDCISERNNFDKMG